MLVGLTIVIQIKISYLIFRRKKNVHFIDQLGTWVFINTKFKSDITARKETKESETLGDNRLLCAINRQISYNHRHTVVIIIPFRNYPLRKR